MTATILDRAPSPYPNSEGSLLSVLVDGTERKIVTSFSRKPIPTGNFDWCATFENYDEGDPVGYGATEQDAITDLLEAASLAES